MSSTIGRIALQLAMVRLGESVRVKVFDEDDNPFSLSSTQVSINGIPGALKRAGSGNLNSGIVHLKIG
jgi:hypothetical protein